MRNNIKNKVQLNLMVAADTKIALHQCAHRLGIKPNAAMELAVARLHTENQNPNLSAKSKVKELSDEVSYIRRMVEEIRAIMDHSHDES